MNKPETRVLAIFTEAMEIADVRARAAYLSKACGTDHHLRQDVEELLQAESQVGDFLPDQPYGNTGSQRRDVDGLRPTQGHTEYVGRRIDRYKLLQKIGEGGCGSVYMAEQEQPVRRKVALKIIKLGMDTRSVVARFEAERQALALMDHPNIAKVLDGGATESGRPYFVMELVRGQKITQYCDEQRFSTRQRLDLFMQVCQAVQHAHQKGVIHRDLKPSNILVTERDDSLPVPKVIDFGIAKATGGLQLTDKTLFTAFEQFVGTPAYMSPEQARMGELDIDTRSDIYSLGVLLYELLTGQPPFDAAELKRQAIDVVLKTIRETDPPRPSTRLTTMAEARRTTVARSRQVEPSALTKLVRGDLDWIVMKCLEKDRTRRYETANGLARDIRRHLAKEPVTARPPSHVYRFQRSVQRHKAAVAAVVAVIGALVLGMVFSSWEAMRAIRAEGNALRAQANEVKQRTAADEARRQTETNRAQLAHYLNKVELQRVEDFFNAGDSSKALAYLAYILRQDPGNAVAAARLYSALTLRGFALRLTPPLRHESRVLFVHFSPDGKVIATASEDKTVRLWDSNTSLEFTKPLRHGARTWFADFSPDGQLLVTASDDQTARVWNAQTGLPVTDPLRHKHYLSCARFSSDGQRVLTASDDGTARIWDAHTGLQLGESLQHTNHVSCAVFSPDGLKAATASDDYTSRIWDGRTGRPLAGPLNHNGRVWYVQFSPDGQRVVTASDDKTARVWNAQTGQPMTGPLQHNAPVATAQFSPNGLRVVTASDDRTARVWDAQTGQPVTPELRHTGRVWFACFSPDGQRVVTASNDGTARVWDAQTGQPLAGPLNHEGGVRFSEFSPDGNRIATASYDGTAQVWEARTGTLLTEPLGHKEHVSWAQFSASGRLIVTASWDKTARVWDAQTAQALGNPLQHLDRVNTAEFSADEQWAVTASNDRTARVWDVQTGRLLNDPLQHDGHVNSAKFSRDGQRIVTSSDDGKARIWETLTGKLLIVLPHAGGVFAADFSPDGKLVVTASADHTARIWDAQTGQPLIPPLLHGNSVACAQFSPDGNWVVTGSYDTTARVWDARTGRPFGLPLKHLDRVVSVQFSPDGTRVVTASHDRTARIWDAQTGQPLTEPLAHKDHVVFAQFSSDGQRVVTASDDGTGRVWDTQTGQPLTEPLAHTERVTSAAFSPDGKRVVTASEDNTARVWNVPAMPLPVPAWAIELAEEFAKGRVNDHRVLETVPYDRLPALKSQAQARTTDDLWSRWAKWFFADPLSRRISPFSDETVLQYVKNRIKENTLVSLQEAVRLSSTNGIALARLARVLVAEGPDANSRNTIEAEWFSARALEFAPDDGEAWSVRAQVLQQAGKLPLALLAIQRALQLQPANPNFWSIQARVLEETNRVDEAYQSLTTAIEIARAAPATQTNSLSKFYLERSKVLRRGNRFEEAKADLRRAMNIPRRDPNTSSRQADLTSYYNASLNQPWIPGDEENNLSSLPIGLQTLASVPFDVRGLIQVGTESQIGERYPAKVEHIEIGSECTRLRFLHSAVNCSSVVKGSRIGVYRVHYVDGTLSEIPIVFGQDVSDWWYQPDEEHDRLVVAWEGTNESSRKVGRTIRLFTTTWQNPTPKLRVNTVDFLSTSDHGAPFLVAITAE